MPATASQEAANQRRFAEAVLIFKENDMQYLSRYFKVMWTDAGGAVQFSTPLDKWTDAELYRREIGGDAEILRY